jgi:two-component system sensor histidine kinase KdpD
LLVEVEVFAVVAPAVSVTALSTGPFTTKSGRARVFEPFEHAGAASGGGSGLGLAITRGFAQVNGGRLWAEPTPGGGATFALALPLADARAGASV